MPKEDLDSVLKLLPGLTPEERVQVRTVVQFLSKGSGIEEPGGTGVEVEQDELELSFESMRSVLRSNGVNCPPWLVFRRLHILRHFEKGHIGVQNYLSEYFPEAKRTDRQRLYRIFGELILERMKRDRLDQKIGIFFQRLNQVPELMNEAFPGYAKQGWLSVILLLGDRDAGT